LSSMRPANGISPLNIDKIVGKKTIKKIKKFEKIKFSSIQ